MKDQQIDDLVDQIERIDWTKMRPRLKRLNQRDRAGTVIPDGYSARTINGDIPAKDPEALTPTERTADARSFAGVKAGPPREKDGKPDGSETVRPLERDPVHECNVHALRALDQMVTALDGILANVRRGEELQRWEKPAGHTSTPCKSEGCEDQAFARGLCDPCRKWVDRNRKDGDVDPMVPASVISERGKRRGKVA